MRASLVAREMGGAIADWDTLPFIYLLILSTRLSSATLPKNNVSQYRDGLECLLGVNSVPGHGHAAAANKSC